VPRNTYNQSVRSLLPLLLLAALVGCGRDTKNEQAVRQGVIDYLTGRQGLNVAAMNVEMKSVIFRENEADATVVFSPKGGGSGSGMTMRYTLELKGNRWVVKSRADSGQNPHGGVQAPGMENPHGGTGSPDGAAPGQLPPGHPSIPPPSDGQK